MTAFERAAALLQERRIPEASQAFEEILRDDPDNVDAHYHASVAQAAQREYDVALRHAMRVAELRPNWWRGFAQAGALYLALDKPAAALGPLKQAYALDPNVPEVLNNIGAALRACGGLRESIEFFRRATLADPSYLDAGQNLANALTSAGRSAEAVVAIERLLASGHASADLYDAMGKALLKIDRVDESLTWFEKALALDPNHASALGHRGNAWLTQGKTEMGRRSLRAAIEAAPNSGEFYHILADASPGDITEADVAKLEMLARESPSESRTEVDYALSRIYDQRGESERGFRHLLAANAAIRAYQPYDESEAFALFDRIEAIFTRDLFERPHEVNQSDRPIFIIGMPRSGTTLIEQVLASHPNVYGAGELSLFTALSDEVFAQFGLVPEAAIRNDAVLREIGDRYLAAIAKLAPPEALRVTDKMPSNYLSAGLIALALPNARIIHARRNPLDTCVSCFSINFESHGLAWSYDLRDLGRYYRRYERLMEHWRAVLPPGRMLEVQYEEMVDDLEAQTRRLLEYCGLPWDRRCLEFYALDRPVRTASVNQVRKPIYRSSVNRADRYGALLDPLKEALS